MQLRYKKLVVLLFGILLITEVSANASKIYSDIPQGHWSENSADVLAEMNIFQGVSSNEFGGSLPVNRYDTVRIINGLLSNKNIPVILTLLADVRSGHPDFKAIMKVMGANLMEPQDNKFNGEKKISRYEFAKLILKTLDYLQAEPISIRIPPKSTAGIPQDKKDIVDKVVNRWQLTDGFTDWDAYINRYAALEMVARAAVIINPDLQSRIGEIKKDNVIISTPEPIITPYPTPVYTGIPTAIPTYKPTPKPTKTPVISTPTPEPIRTPVISIPTPEPTTIPTPVISIPTPEPIRTPVISIPTPEPTTIPTPVISIPTPEPIRTPIVIDVRPTPYIPIPTPVLATPSPSSTPEAITKINLGSKILRNQASLKAFYNFTYSESIPSVFPPTVENVRSKNDTPGFAIGGDILYWLSDYDIPFVKDSGIKFKFTSLGSYVHPATQPDTEISETFKGNLSALYKVYSQSDLDIAAGLDFYIRTNSRTSSKPVDSYWRASKSYLGIGAKTLLGYKVADNFVIEGELGLHYVAQTINERINYSNTQPTPGQQEGNTLDRIGIEIDLGARYDLFKFNENNIFANGNLGIRSLLLDGSQTIVGVNLGSGISF
jgi:hypothetical protein